jgi:hypothetical protein
MFLENQSFTRRGIFLLIGITSIGAILGGVAGFFLGGPPGIIVGAIYGVIVTSTLISGKCLFEFYPTPQTPSEPETILLNENTDLPNISFEMEKKLGVDPRKSRNETQEQQQGSMNMAKLKRDHRPQTIRESQPSDSRQYRKA